MNYFFTFSIFILLFCSCSQKNYEHLQKNHNPNHFKNMSFSKIDPIDVCNKKNDCSIVAPVDIDSIEELLLKYNNHTKYYEKKFQLGREFKFFKKVTVYEKDYASECSISYFITRLIVDEEYNIEHTLGDELIYLDEAIFYKKITDLEVKNSNSKKCNEFLDTHIDNLYDTSAFHFISIKTNDDFPFKDLLYDPSELADSYNRDSRKSILNEYLINFKKNLGILEMTKVSFDGIPCYQEKSISYLNRYVFPFTVFFHRSKLDQNCENLDLENDSIEYQLISITNKPYAQLKNEYIKLKQKNK